MEAGIAGEQAVDGARCAELQLQLVHYGVPDLRWERVVVQAEHVLPVTVQGAGAVGVLLAQDQMGLIVHGRQFVVDPVIDSLLVRRKGREGRVGRRQGHDAVQGRGRHEIPLARGVGVLHLYRAPRDIDTQILVRSAVLDGRGAESRSPEPSLLDRDGYALCGVDCRIAAGILS
ncbi:hypothetical protein D3C76_1175040 [compost metagenome]